MINNTRRKEWDRKKEPPDPLVAQKLSTGKYYLSCGTPPRQRILKQGERDKEGNKMSVKKNAAKEGKKQYF